MAQDFRRFTSNAVGTSAVTIFTANSFDTVVGISLANVHTNAITFNCYINDGSDEISLE